MRKVIYGLVLSFLFVSLAYSAQKVEWAEKTAQSVVAYGQGASAIVPLKVGSDGSLYVTGGNPTFQTITAGSIQTTGIDERIYGTTYNTNYIDFNDNAIYPSVNGLVSLGNIQQLGNLTALQTSNLTIADDFNRPDTTPGTLGKAKTGQTWGIFDPINAYSPYGSISGGKFVSAEGQTVYAITSSNSVINKIGMAVSFVAGGGGVNNNTVALAIPIRPQGSDPVGDMALHFYTSTTSWGVGYQITNGGIVGACTGTLAYPMAVDGSIYNIEVTVADNTALMSIAGQNYSCKDSNFNRVGKYAFFENFYSSGTSNTVSRIHAVWAGNSPNLSIKSVAGNQDFTWATTGSNTALFDVGTSGSSTGGSFLVNTPSLNSTYRSGLAINGTYGTPSQTSVMKIGAYGVKVGGWYGDIALATSNGANSNEVMRITGNSRSVGIGTISPSFSLDVVGTIRSSNSIEADGGIYVTGTAGVSNVATTTCGCKTYKGGICTQLGTCS